TQRLVLAPGGVVRTTCRVDGGPLGGVFAANPSTTIWPSISVCSNPVPLPAKAGEMPQARPGAGGMTSKMSAAVARTAIVIGTDAGRKNLTDRAASSDAAERLYALEGIGSFVLASHVPPLKDNPDMVKLAGDFLQILHHAQATDRSLAVRAWTQHM